MGTLERLQKFLARAGVCSRRAAERLILAGDVAVNGRVVRELGTKVGPGDRVTVSGRAVESAPARKTYVLLHKPADTLTTWSDPQGRPIVRDLVADLGLRLFPVGRLDYDAEGLLLLTDDGDLAFRLTHPRFQVRRTYLVQIAAPLTAAERSALETRVLLEDGPARAIEAAPLTARGGGGWWRVAVAEGRKRLVKRMLAAVGHPVHRLVRVELGGLPLGRLRAGERRLLDPREVAILRGATEAANPPGPFAGALEPPPV